MKILFVSPKFPQSFWSYDYALGVMGKKAVQPPLGLLTVAAMLPAAWEKRLVDLNIEELSDAELAWADYVFLGGMAVQSGSMKEIIARCKAGEKKMIAGGPLFTAAYALFPEIDHFVLNEAELTIASLVADMEKGSVKRLYRSREFADMRTSPTPLWELAKVNEYACVGIQYTRGCPFDCDFCNVTAMLGRKPRYKDAGQIIAELDALHARGFRGRVFFVDDNLIGHKKALREELLPALIAWQKQKGPWPLCTQVSINLADDAALTAQMAEACFDEVFIGIETPDEASLAECSKKQNTKRNMIDDIKKLQRAGLEVQAGFIIGFDNDTAESPRRQFEFIQKSGIVTAMVGQLQAPPGTKLNMRMALEGRLLGFSTGDNTDGSTNIVPKMGLQALREGHEWVLSSLYAPKACYQRIKTFVREYGVPKVRPTAGLDEVKCFFRALWLLGVKSKERFEYWKLLVWALFRKPKGIPVAIRMACIAHHHRIMSERLAAEVKQGDVAAGLGATAIQVG